MFAFPLYLVALAGLAIPIAIHLLSRKEGKIIKIGSVRHVLETSTRQFRGVRLNEILLLILRCAMVVVFCLLLSGLQCTNSKKEKWVLLEKGLEKLQILNAVLDSLDKQGYTIHWLADGFPRLKDSSKIAGRVVYWRLVEQLRKKNLLEVMVFSQSKVNNFKGQRVALPENVRWITQPLPPKAFQLKAIQLNKDSVLRTVGHTGAVQTDFTHEKVNSFSNSFAISPPNAISILLVADTDFSPDQKIVKAALTAIEKSLHVKIRLTENNPKQFESKPTDWLIWLSSQKLPDQSGNVIYFNRQPSAELIRQVEPRQWIFTKRLNEEVALGENLTLQMASLWLPAKNEQAIAATNDQRVLSDSIAWPQPPHEIEAATQKAAADQYLIIALLILLLTERVIAYRRNQ
jgi:hypothetical protein